MCIYIYIPGNPYDHFCLITMASSRIDRFCAYMPYMGTDISLGDSMLYEWELYTNMAYTGHICMHIWGYPYDTSLINMLLNKIQHTSANTALDHPNMVPY